MNASTIERYTVTTALIYANGPIHIGHLAGCYLPADIYVRYLRSQGKDVIFVSGTDEHGVPITIKAKKEGFTPQEVVDKYYKQISKSFEEFGISFDIYSRTSSKRHHQVSQDFFKKMYDKGSFQETISEQYFDVQAQKFLADRYITGTCPNCNNANAYGDQCEKCGSSLSPEELINPKSALSGEVPIKKETKNWYLPLDKLQPQLEKYINSHKEWKPSVLGQCQSWLTQGLHPRAMTRDLEWGVKLPMPDTEGKVLYVWFDAPIGYITFTNELGEVLVEERKNKLLKSNTINLPNNINQAVNSDLYWKDKNTKLVHFIGKDNIVFHCLIFPAMLMEHGEYILPDAVPANEFMNLEGDKISTSRNWAIWLHEYLVDFPEKQDVLRYVLTTMAPESKDSDFTWKDFLAKNNNELVAILGNFINRTLVLTDKYFERIVPQNNLDLAQSIGIEVLNLELIAKINLISENIENYKFRDALFELIEIARIGNKFLQENEPWKKTDNMPLVQTILYHSLQITAKLTGLMEPFMPFSTVKLAKMLNVEANALNYKNIKNFVLESGKVLNKPELLFEKLEKESIDTQIEKLNQTKIAQQMEISATKIPEITKPLATEIMYDDFAKLDIRTATITHAEVVPKTDKLLKLSLDTGIDQRTVVSGIALHYKPEEIIGKKVSLLANLAPKMLKGIESRGMILMAEDADGKLVFVSPESAVANGSMVK